MLYLEEYDYSMLSLILLFCGGAALIAGVVALVYFLTNREDQSE
jgi:hypothetical protein